MDVVDATPLINRLYMENPPQQLLEDDNDYTLTEQEPRSNRRVNSNRHSFDRNHERISIVRRNMVSGTNAPMAHGNEDREAQSTATSLARNRNRKSPQFFYLTMSLVVALLAVIIAKEPIQLSTLTQPAAAADAVNPSWHDWLNFLRKMPKPQQQQVKNNSALNNSKINKKDSIIKNSVNYLSSSYYYRKISAVLLSYTVQAKEFITRYIDPVLLGKLPASTTATSTTTTTTTTTPTPQDGDDSQADVGKDQQQNKEIRPYSLSVVFTELMDKVITSKPRLITFVNLILSLCVVTHAAIAGYFLGDSEAASADRGGAPARADGGTVGFFPPTDYYSNNAFDHQPFAGRGEGGRRLSPADPYQTHITSSTYALRTVGGYLLFKLLLISSVLSPLHTLDVLILLTWFTVLCFQRSLAYMAHMNLNSLMMQQMGVTHSQQSYQQRPHRKRDNAASGILHLLLFVLGLTFFSGSGWVMFFYKAGIPMVLLLLMDSAILILDIIRYIFIYVQGIILEGSYQARMNELEEIQLQQSYESMDEDSQQKYDNMQAEGPRRQQQEQSSHAKSQISILRKSNQGQMGVSAVENEIERAEIQHAFYSNILQTIIFTLELLSSMVTAFHFLHIWYLHGLSFGLVDAILLLHLQSSVSGVIRKVAERHQMFRLSRNLNSIFQDATETEMRQAHACGDLCCICLGSMLGKNVKKLKCSHMYHSHCLRKVVERARSITAARCPICRSCIVGQHREERAAARLSESEGLGLDANESEEASETNETVSGIVAADPRPQHLGNDSALFRFSTEGLLPHWIPLPAISFEIVRRQTNSDAQYEAVGDAIDGRMDRAAEIEPSSAPDLNGPLAGNQRSGPLLHRLLGIVFAPPMTPEEEDAALAQLVEMFPQYERDDLRRELRSRNSIEQVAESILLGSFSGLPRPED